MYEKLPQLLFCSMTLWLFGVFNLNYLLSAICCYTYLMHFVFVCVRMPMALFVFVICTGELVLDNIDTAGFNSSAGISSGAVNPQTVQFPHTEL